MDATPPTSLGYRFYSQDNYVIPNDEDIGLIPKATVWHLTMSVSFQPPVQSHTSLSSIRDFNPGTNKRETPQMPLTQVRC